MLFFARIARFAVGHDDALLSEGFHHGCQERDPPDGDLREQLVADRSTFHQFSELVDRLAANGVTLGSVIQQELEGLNAG